MKDVFTKMIERAKQNTHEKKNETRPEVIITRRNRFSRKRIISIKKRKIIEIMTEKNIDLKPEKRPPPIPRITELDRLLFKFEEDKK